jgi:hypothetical protein
LRSVYLAVSGRVLVERPDQLTESGVAGCA